MRDDDVPPDDRSRRRWTLPLVALWRAGTNPRKRDVLEIRVHGVNNSPPAEMLERAPDAIETVTGHGAGMFWKRKVETPSDGVAAVEAYSWGGQTRLGGGPLAIVKTALVHIGWFLLLPYALVNLAYWSRRIPAQDPAYKAWMGGVGAATTRLFGLVLTLIATAAFMAVAVEIVAVQCYREENGELVCAALPGLFDSAAGWPDDLRIALFSLIPVVILVLLYLITRRERVSFEPGIESFARSLTEGPPEPRVPLLATPGFWSAARVRDTSEVLHLAAATYLIVFLLAYRQLLHGERFAVFAILAGAGLVFCSIVLVVASANPPSEQSAARSRRRRPSPARRAQLKQRFAVGGLIAALSLYAVWLVILSTFPAKEGVAEPAVPIPTVLIGIALLIALWALSWKSPTAAPRWWSFVLLTLAGLAFLATSILPAVVGPDLTVASAESSARVAGAVAGAGVAPREWVACVITIVGMILVGVHVALCRPFARRQDPRRLRAWSGNGPAVALLLALLAATSLSSLLVLGVRVTLDTLPAAGREGIWRRLSTAGSSLGIPDAYEKSAVVLTAVVLVVVGVVVAAAIRHLPAYGLRRLTVLRLRWRRPADGTEEDIEDLLSGVPAPEGDYPPPFAHGADGMERLTREAAALAEQRGIGDGASERIALHAAALARTRRKSQLAHRGEPLGTWVASATALGLLVLISPGAVELVKQLLRLVDDDLATGIREWSTAALAIIATAAVAKVVANAATQTDRPLGIFWDIVGFLPRAGHPFAPPCFSERAVPELAKRIRDQVRAGGAVLLSAHSMGSTLSAATILALRGDETEDGDRITDHLALLSFGTQLRAYFSRFFPSVLGPEVLGVPGVRAPSLWRFDPWHAQVAHEFSSAGREERADIAGRRGGDGDQVSLRGILTAPGITGPRWRSLWRRTDFLGFPVMGYPSDHNPIDRGASEVAPGYLWRIADHSPYLGQDQFRLARAELAHELRRS